MDRKNGSDHRSMIYLFLFGIEKKNLLRLLTFLESELQRSNVTYKFLSLHTPTEILQTIPYFLFMNDKNVPHTSNSMYCM